MSNHSNGAVTLQEDHTRHFATGTELSCPRDETDSSIASKEENRHFAAQSKGIRHLLAIREDLQSSELLPKTRECEAASSASNQRIS